MSSPFVVVVLVGLAACTFDPRGAGRAGADDGGAVVDARVADGGGGDGPVAARHLVLSEIKAVTDGKDSEFIELWNPTDAAIALDDYYLADDDDYFRLPEAVAQGTLLPVDVLNDFVARFPAGATIEAGQVVVIATDQNDYEDEFGLPPDFKTGGGNAETMDVLFGSSNPSLTDFGEAVMLFTWDGQTDLVTDVDLVLVGNMPGAGNLLPDKSGVAIDGPDGDEVATAYRAEAASIVATQERTGPSESYERVALEDGREVTSGGNGLDGHDETSEDTRLTWEQASFGPATPGQLAVLLQ